MKKKNDEAPPPTTEDPRVEECSAWRFRLSQFVDRAASLRALAEADQRELDELLASGARLRFAPRVPGIFDPARWQHFEQSLIEYANALRSTARTELSTGASIHIPSIESDSVRAAIARKGLDTGLLLDAALEHIARVESRYAARFAKQADVFERASRVGSDLFNDSAAVLVTVHEQMAKLEPEWRASRDGSDKKRLALATTLRQQIHRIHAVAKELVRHVAEFDRASGVDLDDFNLYELDALIAEKVAGTPRGKGGAA